MITSSVLFFTFSRFFNAAAVLFSAALSALIVGAESWALVALMHTLFTYLVFFNLGINEGFGQRIIRNRVIYEPIIHVFIKGFTLISLCSILTFFILLKFDITFLLYVSGTSSLLLFSLMRLYYRGLGNLKGLAFLYIYNSFFMLISPVFVYYYNEPLIFIYVFILASPIAAFLSKKTQKYSPAPQYFSFEINNKKLFLKKIRLLISVGFPIMLAGVIFELIITIDRFYTDRYFNENSVGNIGLSLMIVKGGIMILSILNTISFKSLSEHVLQKKDAKLKKLYLKQVALGVLSSVVFIACIYIVIASSIFELYFPSYSQLSTIFVFQAIILLPLSVLFPLSVISNFRFGGTVYLRALIFILVLYMFFVITCHFIIGNLIPKELSIIVFICFVIGGITLQKNVFRRDVY